MQIVITMFNDEDQAGAVSPYMVTVTFDGKTLGSYRDYGMHEVAVVVKALRYALHYIDWRKVLEGDQ